MNQLVQLLVYCIYRVQGLFFTLTYLPFEVNIFILVLSIKMA